MSKHIVPILLASLLVTLQLQLWFGRGSLPDVKELELKLQEQKSANQRARLENERLSVEVNNLKEGLDMVEEKARSELGMVKPNEIYVQINRLPRPGEPSSAAATHKPQH